MALTNQDVTLYQGDHHNIVMTVASGVDLSTATAIEYAAAVNATDASLITKTLGSGVTADSSTQATIALVPGDTSSLSGGYHHELRVTSADGDTAVVAVGTLTVNASVTG